MALLSRRRVRRSGVTRDTNGYVQRYDIPDRRLVDHAASKIGIFINRLRDAKGSALVTDDGQMIPKMGSIDFAINARLASDTSRKSLSMLGNGESAILVVGHHTLASLRKESFRARTVFYIPSPQADTAARQEIIDYLRTDADGVIVWDDADSARFAAAHEASWRRPQVILENTFTEMPDIPGWVVYVKNKALAPWLLPVARDLPQLRADDAPAIRTMPDLFVGITLQVDSTHEAVKLPNVIGLLEGSDSTFKHEYVVLYAPLDASASTSDGVAKKPAADGGRLATLLTLARVFTQPEFRPRRSILFVATTGGSRGDWGSYVFNSTQSFPWQERRVANIQLGGPPDAGNDTLLIDGLDDIKFPVALAWTAAEQAFVLQQRQSAFDPHGETFAFARRAIPTLAFPLGFGGASGASTAVDMARSARMIRLVLQVVRGIADSGERPQLTPEARRRYLQAIESTN